MPFANTRLILKSTSGWSAFKLLLLTARFSRPILTPICKSLLGLFIRKDEVPIRYTQANHTFDICLRMPDQESDLHSILEVAIRHVYSLNPAYAADLVIDGGANIGLFSLQAAAVYPSASLVVCEPLPRNVAQIKKHLDLNRVTANIMPVCLGGAHRTIPFYCRGANASSFDRAKPYHSVLHIDVLSLQDIVDASPAKKVLIKLDIEGMEIETLESYIPNERRAVIIVGELHGFRKNQAALERLCAQHGWSFKVGDLSGEDTIFEAHSPAAALAFQ